MFKYSPNILNDLCVIVIPIYKSFDNLSDDEISSLFQIVKICKNKYEISIVCPNNLDISGYENIYNFSFNFTDPSFFTSRYSYSNLCVDYNFYKSYEYYNYMLIYQLDSWCFSDKLEYFCSLGYDYIGAIHKIKNIEDSDNGEVGNGGLSLRKISSFLRVLENKNYKNLKILEDEVFTKLLKNELNIAPKEIAYTFSIGQYPEIFLQKQTSLPFGCHAYKRNNRWDYWEKYISGHRTLIYTCCDKKYSHFIPLFCAALLYSNINIDIEIGIDKELDENENKAIKYLQKKYPDSKILIKPYFFEKLDGNLAKVNGITCRINTVRFITEPIIKNYYVYISDVDIISLEKDFYEQHIRYINKYNLPYSNKIRLGCPVKKLTGLHFTKYDNYYPLNLNSSIDFRKNDEEILYDLCDIKIDEKYQFRPVHGIHMSFNRKDIHGIGRIPGWGAEKYELDWYKFTSSSVYKNIFKYLDNEIKEKIKSLEEYYTTRKKVIYTCITNNYDNVIDLTSYNDEYDYIVFTDNIYMDVPSHWIIKKIPDKLLKYSSVKQQRYIKTHPHEVLSNYETSIWIDGNVNILNDVSELIYDKYDIEIPLHPHRICIYDEGKRCILLKKDSEEIITNQLTKYEEEGYPTKNGLVQSNIIIRKHNNKDCIKLMEDWWSEIEKYSHRDQLSFNYALWKNKNSIKIFYLDKNIYDSKFFHWNKLHGENKEKRNTEIIQNRVTTNFGGNYDIIKERIIEDPKEPTLPTPKIDKIIQRPDPKIDKIIQLPTPIKRIFY